MKRTFRHSGETALNPRKPPLAGVSDTRLDAIWLQSMVVVSVRLVDDSAVQFSREGGCFMLKFARVLALLSIVCFAG